MVSFFWKKGIYYKDLKVSDDFCNVVTLDKWIGDTQGNGRRGCFIHFTDGKAVLEMCTD